MQDSDTSDLIFDVPALITTAPQGDTIEVEGIGVATNRIARRTARG